MARLLGVNLQHITEWKKGRSKPSGESALAMLELLKTKPKGRKATR
jgi:DNA-binding transcriptional regulator YiaG